MPFFFVRSRNKNTHSGTKKSSSQLLFGFVARASQSLRENERTLLLFSGTDVVRNVVRNVVARWESCWRQMERDKVDKVDVNRHVG